MLKLIPMNALVVEFVRSAVLWTNAVHVEDAVAVVNLARCIGCGACVPTCTSEAIKLYKKDEVTVPPKNTVETYLAIMDKKAELARAEKN